MLCLYQLCAEAKQTWLCGSLVASSANTVSLGNFSITLGLSLMANEQFKSESHLSSFVTPQSWHNQVLLFFYGLCIFLFNGD